MLESALAASPNVVQIISELSELPVDWRQAFLSASRISGYLYWVLIPNPTLSAIVKAFVPTQSTIRLSLNATFHRTPSSQVYPRRCVPASTGIVIQRSVIAFCPGLVRIVILQFAEQNESMVPLSHRISHSSSSLVHPTQSLPDGCSTPSPHDPGVYVLHHDGFVQVGPPGHEQVSVFPALQSTSSL